VTSGRALTAIGVVAVTLWAARAGAAGMCTISATAVTFGNYNVFNAAAVDSTGTVTYRCSGGASNIAITLSKGTSATYSPRRMSRSGELLNYNLYTDAARSTVWGDGTAGTVVYSFAIPPNNSNVNVTVFGRIPAGQDVSAGSYSDTITATINF